MDITGTHHYTAGKSVCRWQKYSDISDVLFKTVLNECSIGMNGQDDFCRHAGAISICVISLSGK